MRQVLIDGPRLIPHAYTAEPDMIAKLKRVAKAKGKSVSELIRYAIAAYVQKAERAA